MRIKDICEINQLSLNKDTDYDTYLYLDTSNLFENAIDKIECYSDKNELPSRAKRFVRDKDILFSTIRPNQNHYGIMENPQENLLVSTGFAVISARKDVVNPYYLYYFLTKERNVRKLQMIAETAVSSYPAIRPDDIGTLKIDLPSIEKQNIIVKDLFVLDKKIKLNSKLINELEEYSQLLYHKWFVDFNFPSEKGLPYNDSGEKMQIIGEEVVPIDWEITPLNNLVEIKTETINPQEFPNKLFKHFSIPVYDETKTYAFELGSTIMSNKYKVNSKNLLVSKLNPWFKRIIYPMDIDEAICSTEFVVWEPCNNDHLEYLYVLTNTPKFTRNCTKASTGTSNSHRRIHPKFMLKYSIFYNYKVVTKFNRLVKPIIEKIHLAKKENQMLEETRNMLIKKFIK